MLGYMNNVRAADCLTYVNILLASLALFYI